MVELTSFDWGAPSRLSGRIPAPQELIPGCRFSPRCALVEDGCLDQQPSMQMLGDHQSARRPPRILAAGRILVGLIPATSAGVKQFGHSITGADGKAEFASVRSRLQFVFQNPYASLNPRMRIGRAVAEPLDIAGTYTRGDRNDRAELLELVGLPRNSVERYPHEFSGGRRQRIVIARALTLNPDFVVCDEPVSALDVSMQAQNVNLRLDLQERLGLSYLFIAHDLAVVRAVSTRVAVMYAGAIVETHVDAAMVARTCASPLLIGAASRRSPSSRLSI